MNQDEKITKSSYEVQKESQMLSNVKLGSILNEMGGVSTDNEGITNKREENKPEIKGDLKENETGNVRD